MPKMQTGAFERRRLFICMAIAGALSFLAGSEATLTIATPAGGLAEAAAAVTHEFLEHTEDELYGYCTQFIILGDGLDVGAVR